MERLTKALSTEHLFTEDDIEALFGGRDAWDTVYANEWFNREGSDGDEILTDYYAVNKAIEYTIVTLTELIDKFWKNDDEKVLDIVVDLKSKLERYEDVWSD